MNIVFFAIILVSFLVAGYRQIAFVADDAAATTPMQAMATGMVDTAGSAVTLAIGLVGVMALFLGFMKVAEAGGLLRIIARTVRPMMVRLFPDVPAEHPAMGAMILNIAANVMGLGNAATPFGIRAMQELDKLNPHKGTATNAMVLFLAINTSSITVLPTGIIALRAAAGSANPAGILPTTLFATICSTTVAIIAVKLYQRFSALPTVTEPVTGPDENWLSAGFADPTSAPPTANVEGGATDLSTDGGAYPGWVSALVLAAIAAIVPLTLVYGREIAPWIIPGLAVCLLGFGFARRVRVYEVFVDGARDGFMVAVRIIPYLVAILVAVGMLRASGALEAIIVPLGTLTGPLGLPAEALPMALLRPLSGSGAYGMVAAVINDPAIGPDSYVGYLVSTLQGSTETTFYVLAVYFGAVQIRRMRHALAAGLTADVAGVLAAVAICAYLYG